MLFKNWQQKATDGTGDLKEINRLITKGMSDIYYWEKLTFSNLRFCRKENLKKCASF